MLGGKLATNEEVFIFMRNFERLKGFDFWHIQTADIMKLLGPEKEPIGNSLLLENYSKYVDDFSC